MPHITILTPRRKQNHPDVNKTTPTKTPRAPEKRPINPTTSPIKKESEKRREKKVIANKQTIN